MDAGDRPGDPVLIIGFNRPDLLLQVIDCVRRARPSRVYIAVDGPRPGHAQDRMRVRACRDAAQTVDWTSDVHELCQPVNRGCGRAVSTALDWFFSHEEQGVIFEDDILPAPSFLGFCSTLLSRYSRDSRIAAISGCNLVPAAAQTWPGDPYRFSQVTHVWGWATWRRAWELYRFDMHDWRDRLSTEELFECTGRSVTGALHWAAAFEAVRRGLIDTWDVQWVFATMCSGTLTATSNANLAWNQGFDRDPTHPVQEAPIQQPLGRVIRPLPPVPVRVDRRADTWTLRHHFQAPAWAAHAVRSEDPTLVSLVREVRALSAAGEPAQGLRSVAHRFD